MKNTKKSFHFAVFSSVLLIVFTILGQTVRTAANTINDITAYFITLFFISIFFGAIFSVLSFKEPFHWKKYVGIGINFFFLVMTSLALIGNLKDVVEAFS
ncbi:hypothetical protein [Nonlabens sp.]|uniref:hypothetical protein n=1 Tax=Nonlabens sp. TaxID=1888209 RepID=UPI001BCD3C2F|nr:hypothetical protein [Nonlabens sp.]